MLEFKHPSMTASLSAKDFLSASTRPKQSTPAPGSRSIFSKKSAPKDQRGKGIDAVCVLPTVLFLGTEMFTPTGKDSLRKPSADLPEIVITTDEDDKAVELPPS